MGRGGGVREEERGSKDEVGEGTGGLGGRMRDEGEGVRDEGGKGAVLRDEESGS